MTHRPALRGYRANARPEIEAAAPKQRKGRTIAVIAFSVVAHVAVLATAFVMRAEPTPGPRTEVVRVLTGHVDPMTGSFHAEGLHDARIKLR